MKQHFDEALLMAYIDSELGDDQQKEVEKALQNNVALRQKLAKLRQLDAELRSALEPALHEPFPEIQLPAAGRGAHVPAPSRLRTHLQSWIFIKQGELTNPGRVAYTCAVAFLGVLVGQSMGPSQSVSDADMQALFSLREVEMAINMALEKEPRGQSYAWNSSVSGNTGYVTPIKTWQTENLQYCREFRLEHGPEKGDQVLVQIGLACREADGYWKSTQMHVLL